MTKSLHRPTEAPEVLGMSRSVDQSMALARPDQDTLPVSATPWPQRCHGSGLDPRSVLFAWRTAIPPSSQELILVHATQARQSAWSVRSE